MKFKKVYLSGLFVFLVLGVVYFLREESSSPFSSRPLLTVKENETFVARVRQHPGLPEAKLSADEKGSDCQGFLEALETKSVDALTEEFLQGKISLDKSCWSVSEGSRALLEQAAGLCQNSEPEKKESNCMLQILMLKALRIFKATEGENIYNLPTEILIQRFIGIIVDANFTQPEKLQSFRTLGEELQRRLPQSESAARASLLGYIMDEDLNSEELMEFDRRIQEARQSFPENTDIFEMQIVKMRIYDIEGSKALIDSYYRSYPNAPIALYFMGCKEWGDQRYESAQSYFKRAQQMSPQTERFTKTYRESLLPERPERVCSFTFNFDPSKF